MRTQLKRTLKTLAPPLLLDHIQVLTGTKIRFTGDFKSWSEAEAASGGYSTPAILEQTIKAARRVKSGMAAFERDGVAFKEMEYNFPLAWALMRTAARCGKLHVLDFGGSLGSSYFQSRTLVRSSLDLRWAIVDQLAHVEAGKKEFANTELSFHTTIDEACQDHRFDALLLSGVIQCLSDPYGFLEDVLNRRIPSIILDRTPFMVDGTNRLTIERVPRRIYRASYPAWFFCEKQVLSKFAKHYDQVATWPALDKHHPQGGRAHYKGFLFELKPSAVTLS